MRTGSASAPEPGTANRRRSLEIRVRPALPADLAALNAVIGRAVMTWRLPDRVKRLAMPSYRYHSHDLDHLELLVAECCDGRIVGVAALEEAAPRDLPAGRTGLLLHGLYVDPEEQGCGVGSRLLQAAGASTRARGYDGLLVKAQPDAVGFFAKHGLTRLEATDPARDYPYRFWLEAAAPLDA